MGKNFRRKAQFLADEQKTKNPAAMTYSSVVSRDLVQIALTISVIFDLDVLACDIQNAYTGADCREQVWVVAGTKFGSEAGKNMLVSKAIYILKGSITESRDFLADTLNAMVYRPIYPDPCLWLCPEVNPDGK